MPAKPGAKISNSSRIFKLQKAALRIMTSDFQAPSKPLFSYQKLLKISDLVKLNNLLLIHDLLNDQSPSSLSNTCTLVNHTPV